MTPAMKVAQAWAELESALCFSAPAELNRRLKKSAVLGLDREWSGLGE